MSLPLTYHHQEVATKWHNYWLEHKYFHSIPNEKEPYAIVIPPPNVTGVLHMGHMLNNTIQDVLVRRARALGKNACWVPGTDHASIATEAKVVAKLKQQGIEKSDLTKEEFLKHAWEWTEKHGGIILEQLKKLGASCDWDRAKFTLDDDMSESVKKVFIDLYEKGLIYRGYRMVNWDPEAKTTLSDEEVIYEERAGKLYYINYQLENSAEKITIATTRPETIFGDTAICVHPNDERYQHLAGKKAIVPIANRVIPIISDTYVDMEFGTGCLKITPAHDPNDKVLGDKHQLQVVSIFNDDATLNENGLHYQGKDRFVIREEIEKELQQLGCLTKVEAHTNKVGTSERTKAVIEPKISVQWFLKMESFVKPALDVVLKNEEIKFFPKHYNNTYKHWLENLKDWNISRQLWWGHEIPAFYYDSGVNDFVVAENREQAAEKASKKLGRTIEAKELKQEQDVLDTWFSAWLWPISVFDGIRNPDNADINYYYPTNDLVTGPDIIFFWVARMVFAGQQFRSQKPFSNVYFTGIVRDKQRRKMSKQLGNSPDPVKLIEKYGADAVRVGLMLCASAGNDLMFDESLCDQGKRFSTKIWNAFRLIHSWKYSDELSQPEASKISIEWYESKLQKTIAKIDQCFEQYRISEALMNVYKLIFDDFCGILLEIVKPGYQEPIDACTYQSIHKLLEDNLVVLHPFMPFLTEEIWQQLSERTPEQALVIAPYPEKKSINEQLLSDFTIANELISNVRNIRKNHGISFKNELSLFVLSDKNEANKLDSVLCKLCNLSEVNYVNEKKNEALSFRVNAQDYFVPLPEGGVNSENELLKLNKELTYAKQFLASIEKKLSNEKFVQNAPEKVLENERKKQADALAKIATISASLEKVN